MPLTLGLIGLCGPARAFLSELGARGAVDLLALFTATSLAAFAIFIWAARFRSPFAYCLAIGVALGGMQPAWDASSFGAGTWWPLTIAGLIALGGLALLWDAYRRWLLVDLD